MKVGDIKFFLTVGLVGVAGYFIYQAIKGLPKLGSSIVAAPAEIGNSIGGSLYEWINPYPAGTDTFYTPTFPDGSRHAVHSTDVGSTGAFVYNNQNYILRTNANGQRFAVAT